MTLAIILFLLVITAIMLLTIPVPREWPDLWVNIKFWAVVVACWMGVAWVAMYA